MQRICDAVESKIDINLLYSTLKKKELIKTYSTLKMYHILKNKVRCEGTRQLQKLTTGANINGQRLVTVHLQNQVKKI